MLCEQLRCRLANAASRPCNDGNFVFEKYRPKPFSMVYTGIADCHG